MLKLVHIPIKYKGFSFTELHEEMEEQLKKLDIQQEKSHRLYADLILMENKIANLSEEEAAHNIKVIVAWMKKELGL